ncbi:hypothetical protein R5W24_005602 [Gemmata sp. JC717]|uniref:hypothetical protein n=1 Tax=Gemmata algarum TaxID=2975278 RepID=UPI0021BAA2F7|nr:hypothetical protein [Gemmata algarum]MDY3556436.1 hypothetical protein [Gemmata algarum]
MGKPFDATLNTLIDAHLGDWAAFLGARVGVPPGPATPLDTDLSATLQVDRLFRIDGASPAALHLELESSGRLGIPGELLRYNVAAWAVNGLPVHSVLVLLRPKATATDLTGTLELTGAGGTPYLTFRYTVVRVWLETVDALLAAGPGVAPLALLTNEADADLPAAFVRFRQALRSAAVPDSVERGLLGSTFVLCGLRYDPARVETLYRELSMTLEDSTTYQLILSKGLAQGEARGAVAEAQRLLLLQGQERFGAPDPAAEAALRAVTDRNRLEQLARRVLTATGWSDLLATN